jgi:hypothetical protein
MAQNDGFSSIDINALPRYALAETGVATDAVASSTASTTATTTAATTTGTIASVSGWTWAVGAVAVIGGGVAVASSGGSSNSAPADTTAPSAVAIAPVATNDIVTAGEKIAGVTVSGTAEANATVTLTWGITTKTVTATNGTFSVDFASNEIPTDGSTSVTATAKDKAGNVSIITTHAVTVNTVPTDLSAADGYLRGATVWIDTNHDGEKDFNTGITTDTQGNFSLDADTPHGTIIAVGGINIDTGVPNTMILKAPEGSTVINPLTTLVEALIQASKSSATPLSVQDASAKVVAALGLTAGTDLTTYDPINQNDVSAQKVAATVATIIILATNSATDTAAATLMSNTIISNIITKISANSGTIDFTKATTITDLISNVNLGTDTKDGIATASSSIQAATSLETITTAQSKALDSVAPQSPTLTAATISNDSTPTIRINLDTTSNDGKAVVVGDTVIVKTVSDQSITIILKAADIAAGYITIDSSTLSDGDHTISVLVQDKASNNSADVTHTLTIDTIAPSVPNISIKSTITSSSDLFSEGEATSNFEYSVDGKTWSSTLVPNQWFNAMYVRQVDLAGNVSASTQVFDFMFDATTLMATTLGGMTQAQAKLISDGSGFANFTATQILALNDVAYPYIPITVIINLTSTQVNNLSTVQLGLLTAPQVEALANAKRLDSLSVDNVIVLANHIAYIPTTVIVNLTAVQINNFSTVQLGSLTKPQVEALSNANKFDALDAQHVVALGNYLSYIPTTVIINLTSIQINNFTTIQLGTLTESQVKALSDAHKFDSLDTDHALALATNYIAYIPTTVIVNLTSIQINNFTTIQLGALTELQVKALSDAHKFDSLDTDHVLALATNYIAYITTTVIVNLTAVQINNFTTTQLASLTESQIKVLVDAKLLDTLSGDHVVALASHIAYIPTTAIRNHSPTLKKSPKIAKISS